VNDFADAHLSQYYSWFHKNGGREYSGRAFSRLFHRRHLCAGQQAELWSEIEISEDYSASTAERSDRGMTPQKDVTALA
jgi:hypothetical protein